MRLTTSLIAHAILFVLCCAYFREAFPLTPVADTAVFLPLRNFPDVDTVQYWCHIFTHPNGHEGQYRPLGFFAYFYLLGNIFGTNLLLWRLLSLGIISATALTIKQWAEENSELPYIGWLAALFFIFSPAISFSVFDISCTGKYILTGYILAWQFLFIQRQLDPRGRQLLLRSAYAKSFALFFVNSIAILLHEGSVVFPVIIVGYAIVKSRKVHRYTLAALVPVCLYFSARFFVFGFPQKGAMRIGFDQLWNSLGQSQEMIWHPIFLVNPGAGYLAGAIVIAIATYRFRRSRRLLPLFLVAASATALAPFLMLERHHSMHIPLKGCYWASIIALFFWVSCVPHKYAARRDMRPVILAVAVVVGLVVSTWYDRSIIATWRNYEKSNRDDMARVAAKIDDLPNAVEIDIRANLTGPADQHIKYMLPSWVWQSQILPGLLAENFGDRVFILPNSGLYDEKGEELKVLVQQGYYVYILDEKEKSITVRDRFGYISELGIDISGERSSMEL